jgi:uncharacterized membrane protein YkvA (DUF1232 family)
MTLMQQLKTRARALKADTYALYLAARHKDTPWYAKAFTACVAAYALSPIDLIPDFIPVVGYLDDLILVPLGLAVAVKMVPPAVMCQCREQARERMASGKPVSRAGAAFIVLIWLAALLLAGWWVYEVVR